MSKKKTKKQKRINLSAISECMYGLIYKKNLLVRTYKNRKFNFLVQFVKIEFENQEKLFKM